MHRYAFDGPLVSSQRLEHFPFGLGPPDDNVVVLASADEIFGTMELQGSDAAAVRHQRTHIATRVGVVYVDCLVVATASDHTACFFEGIIYCALVPI